MKILADERTTPIVKKALNQSLREMVNERITKALHTDQEDPPETVESAEVDPSEEVVKNGILTTDEEQEAFHIIKAIVREMVDVKRINMRDTKSYCGVLLDDNNRKPICRLHFNTMQKYIGIITQKKEERIPIDGVDDIFKHSDSLKATVAEYL